MNINFCHECALPFTLEKNLKRHISECHSDTPKSFRCNHDGCDATFLRKENLKAHIWSVHEAPFDPPNFAPKVCTICNHTCHSHHALLKHMRQKHPTNEPTFYCRNYECWVIGILVIRMRIWFLQNQMHQNDHLLFLKIFFKLKGYEQFWSDQTVSGSSKNSWR